MSAVLEAREQSARYVTATPPLLVRDFHLLATAPGAARRLRELIVLLALQGKLVSQDPRDASALEWLAAIQTERRALVANGRAKLPKVLPPVDELEQWFDLPIGWHWARLNELVTASEAGWSPSCPEAPRQGDRWGVLKVSAVSWGKFDPEANKELPDELAPKPEYEVRAGDFLLSRANTAELVARSVVVDDAPPRLMLSDKIIRLTFPKSVNRAYLNLYNNSAGARSYYSENASGTSSSMKNVSRDVVLGLPIAIPPLAEQARIVARIDELMRLCDALEAKGRLEAEQHARLLGTLLGTLTDSSTPEELAANWQRVDAHFDLLLDRPAAVDALEQTILQLAVRGLLVPQDPSDEPARVLLERIRAEKERLIATGKVRRDKPLSPLPDDDEVFAVPAGWQWARMGDVVLASEAGWSPTCHATPRRQGKWGVLKVSAVSWGTFDAHANKELPDDLVARPEHEVMPGDFLLSRANTEELVARSVVVCETPPQLMLSDKIIRLDVSTHVDRVFLSLANNAKHSRAFYVAHASGTSSSMKNVSREVVLSLPLALPPFAEQVRIVARVTELRRLCADLRQRLVASQTTQSHLAEALVDAAIA